MLPSIKMSHFGHVKILLDSQRDNGHNLSQNEFFRHGPAHANCQAMLKYELVEKSCTSSSLGYCNSPKKWKKLIRDSK